MAIAAVKVIWVPSDNKTGYLRDCFAIVFVALNFVKLLNFSEQDFILETVMCGYIIVGD